MPTIEVIVSLKDYGSSLDEHFESGKTFHQSPKLFHSECEKVFPSMVKTWQAIEKLGFSSLPSKLDRILTEWGWFHWPFGWIGASFKPRFTAKTGVQNLSKILDSCWSLSRWKPGQEWQEDMIKDFFNRLLGLVISLRWDCLNYIDGITLAFWKMNFKSQRN